MEATSAVVQAIQQGTEVQQVEMDGNLYFDRKVHLPPAEPQPEMIHLSTLQSLVDFYKSEVKNAPDYLVVVNDPQTVSILGPIEAGRHKQRTTYAKAYYERLMKDRLKLDEYLSIESMIVQLMSDCQDLGDRDYILDLLSHVTTQDVAKLQDDGLSQTLTVEKGFKVQQAAVKRIVELHPYSTFREIEVQPRRQFLLRQRQGRNEKDLPLTALFRADGDTWKLQAMASVKMWLDSAFAASGIQNAQVLA